MGTVIPFLDLTLVIVFGVLACLHFIWAFGSTIFFDYSIPTNKEGHRLFHPTWIQSAIVGIGLSLFASIYYFKGVYELPYWMLWIVPVVFTLRIMGDFKYFGLFKSIKHTTFGKSDSRFILPLCSFLVLTGVLSAIYS